MARKERKLFDTPRLIPVMFLLALALYVLRQVTLAPDFMGLLHLAGNDDGMRLLAVRDLMSGQSWFDMSQHRVLPPEGLSLHWSRFVDAPIALMLLGASQILDMAQAERIVLLLWPMAMFASFAGVSALAARSLFGVPAAVFTLISLWFIQSYQMRYFPIGRLDHHNVQLVLMLSVFALQFSSRFSWVALSGGLAALSFAIGVETLPFVALNGAALIWLYLRQSDGSETKLAGFSIGLGVFAPLFFMAQTDPSTWGVGHCDQLSVRYLGLTTAALGLGLVVWFARGAFETKGRRIVLCTAAAVLAAIAAYPSISACAAGPFAEVPEEVRREVIARIGESAGLGKVFSVAPMTGITLALPVFLITCLSALITLAQPKGSTDRLRWGLLLLFLIAGCLGAFIQLRAMIWAHAVMAIGFGAVAAYLANRNWSNRGFFKGVALSAFCILVFLPQVVPIGWAITTSALGGSSAPAHAVKNLDQACNKIELLAKLQEIPQALILAPLNLGVGILVTTEHSVAAAPYHRQTKAMLNGVLPFMGNEEDIKKAVVQSAAAYVLVCQGEVYGHKETVGTNLGAGLAPAWLQLDSSMPAPLMLYRVSR